MEYCALPVADMDAVYQVLEKDSQAGSVVSREALREKKSGITEAHLADLARELEAHPTIHSPDFRIPTM